MRDIDDLLGDSNRAVIYDLGDEDEVVSLLCDEGVCLTGYEGQFVTLACDLPSGHPGPHMETRQGEKAQMFRVLEYIKGKYKITWEEVNQ